MSCAHRNALVLGRMKPLGLGLLVALILLSPLRAQTVTTEPPGTTAATPAQAPDDMTKKITDLVHAGKYLEAQQLTTGLLVAYPDDQRLIKAKALIEKLLAPPAVPAGAVPVNEQPSNNGSPAHPTVNTGGQELTGMDKVAYNALIELAREAQQTTDLAEQNKLLQQFMAQSDVFLQRYPDQMLLWQLRAASAISLNEPIEGYKAGNKLINAGAADSSDPALQRLLGQLKNKGWLEKQEAETLQQSVDKERAQQLEAADRARFTFPVVHAKVGFGSNGYGYGHIVINRDGAVYQGTDETIRLVEADIREVKVACNVDACGMSFNPKSGRRYFFLAVTEEAVTNRTDKGKIFLKPYVLGNAVVSKWNFVSLDNKTLGPPKAGTSPKNPEPVVQMVPSPVPTSKPAPAPTAQETNSSTATNNPAPPPAVPAVPALSSTNDPAHTETAPVPTTAVLHLYRLHQFAGMGVKTNIEIDGKKAAQIANGQAFRMLVAPGKHNITASARKAKADLPIYDLDMEAGKEYWVRVDFSAKFFTYVKLYVEPAEKAMADSGKLEEIKLGDPSRN